MQKLLVNKKDKQNFYYKIDNFINKNIKINPDSYLSNKIESYEELKNRIIEKLNNARIDDTIFIYSEDIIDNSRIYIKPFLIFECIGKHNVIIEVGISKDNWYRIDDDTEEKILISKYNELNIKYKYESQKYDDYALHNKILEFYKQIMLLNFNTKMIATLDEYLKFSLYESYRYTSYNYKDVLKQELNIKPKNYEHQNELIKKILPRMINNLKNIIKNKKIDYDELDYKTQSIEWKEYKI